MQVKVLFLFFLKCLNPENDIFSMRQVLFIRNNDYLECCCYKSNYFIIINITYKYKYFSKMLYINIYIY